MLIQTGDAVAVIDLDVVSTGAAIGGVHDTTCGGGDDLGSGTAADIDALMVGGCACRRSSTISEIGGYFVTGGAGPEPAGRTIGRIYFIIGSGGVPGRT